MKKWSNSILCFQTGKKHSFRHTWTVCLPKLQETIPFTLLSAIPDLLGSEGIAGAQKTDPASSQETSASRQGSGRSVTCCEPGSDVTNATSATSLLSGFVIVLNFPLSFVLTVKCHYSAGPRLHKRGTKPRDGCVIEIAWHHIWVVTRNCTTVLTQIRSYNQERVQLLMAQHWSSLNNGGYWLAGVPAGLSGP